MWTDNQRELEELEARLYSQVHHCGGNGDSPPPTTPASNTPQEDASRRFQRYFDKGRSPYTTHKVYRQTPPSFQASKNFESSYIPQKPPYYKSLGMFTFPEFVINPTVNNIVLLPTPPAPIISEEALTKKYRLEKKRQKEREKRAVKRRAKRKNMFKEHRLRKKIQSENLKREGCGTVKSLDSGVVVICLSESDSSVCELAETSKVEIVLISSDDEDPSGIKHEIAFSDAANVYDNQVVDNIKDTIQDGGMVVQASEDDDVIFVKPEGQNEIIDISCEESQSENIVERNNLATSSNIELDTAESTNDFLDNSLNMSQSTIDVDFSGNDVSGLIVSKSGPEIYETESSCSASDLGVPSRSTIFAEQEFGGSANELNLDSFTDYIAAEKQTSSRVPSILTSLKKFASCNADDSTKTINVRCNSSDSSSESDYEENKVALVEGTTRKLRSVSTSSSDDSTIKENDQDENKSGLPNLSPITSDEEVDTVIELNESDRKLSKSKRVENVRVSGEKRKSNKACKEVADTKRIKEAENNVADTFFSSSDECSDFQIDNQPHRDSSSCDVSALELVNIETSTPTKAIQEKLRDKSNSFLNYWTDDMQKFYSESWGHENFSVEEELKAMSDDPSLWKIIDRDRSMVKTSNGPRCRRCRELGHKAMHCKAHLGPPKCILCGASGHCDARCPDKLCTACGRRSKYFTTYCSRCANSRKVTCSICSMRGHHSIQCTDTWRRYHLTTEGGPLRQPSDTRLKARHDRWCSGCASRGHFEYDCNYYNRTHAPANPFVFSYEDAYRDRSPTRRQQQNFPAQRINPWQLNPSQGSPQPLLYDQRFRGNFVQNPLGYGGLNPHFYQQFPIFQSMPANLGWQQNLNNFLQQPPGEQTSNYRAVYNNNGSGETSTDTSTLIGKSQTPTSNPSEKIESECLRLKYTKAKKLFTKQGEVFLSDLRNDTNLNIKLQKRGKKGFVLCTLEGTCEQILLGKDKLRDYYTPDTMYHDRILQLFQGTDFTRTILQVSLSKLKDPGIQWKKYAHCLIQRTHQLSHIIKSTENTLLMQKELKNCFVALNAIVLGKFGAADGPKHMEVLEHWKSANEEELRKSYNYVFKNSRQLRNFSYKQSIKKWNAPAAAKSLIDERFHSGMEICRTSNMFHLLDALESSYKQVLESRYSQKCVASFTKIRKQIRTPK